MGSRGSSGTLGERASKVGTDFIPSDWDAFKADLDMYGENVEKFYDKLIVAGVFGTAEQIEEEIKNSHMWRMFEGRQRDAEKHSEYGYKQVDLDTWLNSEYAERQHMYLSFEDYKELIKYNIKMGGDPRSTPGFEAPGTLGEGLSIYFGGASKFGYGRGKDARINWDEEYGFSNMLEKHPELQYNGRGTLFRGLRLSDGSMKSLEKALKTGDSIDFRGPSSWTSKAAIAKEFTEYSLVGSRNKNLVIFEEVSSGRRTAMPFFYGTDSELLYSGKAKFKPMSMIKDKEGYYHVKVKEIR